MLSAARPRRRHAQEINAHPETEVALVWDDDPVRGEEFARKLGVPFEPDLKKVLQDEEIDAVCVNTATTLHRDVLTAAAKAGKHIFTEKVLAPTCEEAYAIANTVNEAGVKFVISFPHRAKPHNLFAKQVVEQGLLGDISLLRIPMPTTELLRTGCRPISTAWQNAAAGQ